MTIRFSSLTRPGIRRLKTGEKITERGITAEMREDGNVRYSINIMVDGQRIHRVIGLASDGTTRTQAEEFISKARSEAKERRLKLPVGRKLHLTFETAAALYLEGMEEIQGKNLERQRQHLRSHLVPFFGTQRIDHLSKFTVEKFGKHCRDKGLSDATVNRSLATYRQMGRRLFDWNKIPKPFPMIKLKPERNHRTYVISIEEEKRLLDAALHDGSAFVWLFISIGLGTGLRHGEILGARFEHFDAVRRRLNVLAKGGSWRKQPLTRGLVSILERERSMAVYPDGWIFPSNRSKSGHITSMKGAFARCVKIAGMDPNIVIPHAMRHTAISRLAATGADIKTLQEFSGHLSISMVMRYAHSQGRTVDAALDRMEDGTIIEHPAMRKPQDS